MPMLRASTSSSFRVILTFMVSPRVGSVALGQSQHVLAVVVQGHLLGDGRDLVEPYLAPQPLDVELLGVAVAAVGLERDVAGLEAGLGRHELGDVGLRATRLAVVEA